MDIKEQAKLFAVKAHMGQVRKSEPDKPKIMHTISVGNLLQYYGYDDNVVAAGYLHDVDEDTEYTIRDIESLFGSDVAALVMGASEPDKSLSWEERKSHTIKEVKNLSFRNKLVVCADKINNLEDLLITFLKNGKKDFSAFKRGEEQQKWYYESVYESLVYPDYADLPIFKRLKNVIEYVFEEKEDLFLKNTIFGDNQAYYEKLKQLHAKKVELERLKALCDLDRPYVIEFSGTPRTGKTTTINNLCDFFKKGGFSVKVVEEFTTSKYYKETLKDEYKKVSTKEKNVKILNQIYEQLKNSISSNCDIILIDRSINDRQIWNYELYNKGEMEEDFYLNLRDKYSAISKEFIDFLVITYTDALTSLKRDYNSSLSLESRSFLNVSNIEEYNNSVLALKDLFDKSVDNVLLFDTTMTDSNAVAIESASLIMDDIRKKYIKSFVKKYNLK